MIPTHISILGSFINEVQHLSVEEICSCVTLYIKMCQRIIFVKFYAEYLK